MAPRAIRAAAFAAAVAGSQAMTVTQVPSGLRLRGGIDIGKVAQNVAGIFNKGPGDSMTTGSVNTGGLRGGGADFAEIRKLMEGENLSESAIGAFQQAYEQLVSGKDGMISEKDISPAADVPGTISKALPMVPWHRKCTRSLTFENLSQ
jgi:hypothetical protein